MFSGICGISATELRRTARGGNGRKLLLPLWLAAKVCSSEGNKQIAEI